MRVTIRETFGARPHLLDLPWSAPQDTPQSANVPDMPFSAFARRSVVDLYTGWADVPMRGHTPKEKPVDLPLIAFGHFDRLDQRGQQFGRGSLNPEGLWCIALDFDDAHPDVFARILHEAKGMSRVGLVHTTWKHGLTRGLPASAASERAHDPWVAGVTPVRARIIMPCVDPDWRSGNPYVAVSAWDTLWTQVVRALGADRPGSGLDTQCRNPERCWYLPCRNVDAPEWASHLQVWG